MMLGITIFVTIIARRYWLSYVFHLKSDSKADRKADLTSIGKLVPCSLRSHRIQDNPQIVQIYF